MVPTFAPTTSSPQSPSKQWLTLILGKSGVFTLNDFLHDFKITDKILKSESNLKGRIEVDASSRDQRC